MGLDRHPVSLFIGMVFTFLGVSIVKIAPGLGHGNRIEDTNKQIDNSENLYLHAADVESIVDESSVNSGDADNVIYNSDAAELANIFDDVPYGNRKFSRHDNRNAFSTQEKEVKVWLQHIKGSKLFGNNYQSAFHLKSNKKNDSEYLLRHPVRSIQLVQGGSDVVYDSESNNYDTNIRDGPLTESHMFEPKKADVELKEAEAEIYVEDDMVPRIKFISAGSCTKLGFVVLLGVVGAFLNVSPRNAPPELYFELFKRNLLILGTTLLGPVLVMLTLHDPRRLSADTVISVFFAAFTWGYVCTFLSEIIMATLYRLAVLSFMEPEAFNLCPEVPVIYLPWVLKDYGYFLKPLTSFVADFVVYCFGAPIVEEAMKVFIARRSGYLPKKRKVPGTNPVHVHTYVVLIVAASMGLKVADNARRVLMYNKNFQSQKFLFALLRGFFPLHDICAAITAMKLARKEVLGEKISTIGAYFPALFLHGWANFRGGKPMFKWKSDSPWVELQMGGLRFPDGVSVREIIERCALSILWCTVSLAVLSYTIRTYWGVSRRQYQLKGR